MRPPSRHRVWLHSNHSLPPPPAKRVLWLHPHHPNSIVARQKRVQCQDSVIQALLRISSPPLKPSRRHTPPRPLWFFVNSTHLVHLFQLSYSALFFVNSTCPLCSAPFPAARVRLPLCGSEIRRGTLRWVERLSDQRGYALPWLRTTMSKQADNSSQGNSSYDTMSSGLSRHTI